MTRANGNGNIRSNGNGVVKLNGHASQVTEAWKALSLILPPRNPDYDWWWRLTGQHLAALVEAAGYSPEKQYEALLFHYHWTVPYMGQAPLSEGRPIAWKSLLGLDGTPIEYSWKWNTAGKQPDVRYATEPIGQAPGSEIDPLNQQALKELLHGLTAVMPAVDLSWVNHFMATLYDHDNSKYVQEAAAGASIGTSVQLAAEFKPSGISLKTNFFPRKLGENGPMSVDSWESAIGQLDPENDSRRALTHFLATSPEGKFLTPFSVGVDNVAPEKSRLKWYFSTPRTAFASVREVMTLGGRIDAPYMAKALSELHDLIKAVVGLPADFPEDAELSAAPHWDASRRDKFGALSGYRYYFDVAPGAALPEVKVFIPARYYAADDLALARGITAWMRARGRGAYCDRYVGMLGRLAGHRRLDEGTGIQTYVACLFTKGGELDITTYLGAEAFHPARVTQPRRATRRRGEW
ncbi:dimethylallyl tryptophan synthase GliD1 [Biscogniauxia mediterranea]|nr:dimethylallyl tryptophan synthase GliD1 [Biscogniauxia mediterranea]